MKYYIKDNYYFDLDHNNQFRITGPENHLLFGVTFFDAAVPQVEDFTTLDGQLQITLRFTENRIRFNTPLVTDIRTLRSYTESASPRPLYSDLVERVTADVLPRSIERFESDAGSVVRFYNEYLSDDDSLKVYGSEIHLTPPQTITDANGIWEISDSESLTIQLHTYGNIQVSEPLAQRIFREDQASISPSLFSEFLQTLYSESELHIEHLIQTKKTSSFEYGTIFPRDWIESADLGEGDLSNDAIDYLYTQSMNYVSETGEGWHEEAIGEYRRKAQAPIDRKMIDIEPRYILGLRRVSKHFLTQESTQAKLRLVAQYVINQASTHELISFKKVLQSETEYQYVGNWRDSYYAFPRQKSPLSPYDVNCVFYPIALRIIREFQHYFQVPSPEMLTELIEKWDNQKRKFRLYHPGGRVGYSLAVHGRKNIPLPIPHLDESYDLFYGMPSLEEVISFAEKLVDPDYFYTPVGPQLVTTDEEQFGTEHYHGQVIWPKQTAFAVAGLARQYRRGQQEGWAWPVLESLKQSLITTCEASFRGWENLQAVPELYYYDRSENRARFYTDQEHMEGQMSLIQLWSSVGCRRIIREYQQLREEV
jgi:hypothetical protein